jgi:glycosyltransferase involved in cell wall biosynthesis
LYLAVNPTYKLNNNSGYGTHMRGIINAFKEEGHQVRTLVGKNGIEKSRNKNFNGGKTLKIKNLKKYIPNFLWRDGKQFALIKYNNKVFTKLKKIMDEFKPAIIYERAEYLSNSGVKLARSYKIPIFLEANALLESQFVTRGGKSILNLWGRRYEQYIYQNCSGIFAISGVLKRHIAEKFDVSESKISVAGMGVNPGEFRPEIDCQKMRRNLSIADNEVVVGYIGSFHRWYGIENIVETVNSHLREYPQLKFLLIGGGQSEEEVLKKVRDYNLTDRIITTGRVPYKEIPDYLQVMDICVLPGSEDYPNWYSSPGKIIEYGIMAKPVICYRAEPNEEIISKKEGILINPGSIEELSKGIIKLSRNPELRKELGKNLQKKVLENFTWNKIGSKILKVIKNEIGK